LASVSQFWCPLRRVPLVLGYCSFSKRQLGNFPNNSSISGKVVRNYEARVLYWLQTQSHSDFKPSRHPIHNRANKLRQIKVSELHHLVASVRITRRQTINFFPKSEPSHGGSLRFMENQLDLQYQLRTHIHIINGDHDQ
jgi:hypothetical protein